MAKRKGNKNKNNNNKGGRGGGQKGHPELQNGFFCHFSRIFCCCSKRAILINCKSLSPFLPLSHPLLLPLIFSNLQPPPPLHPQLHWGFEKIEKGLQKRKGEKKISKCFFFFSSCFTFIFFSPSFFGRLTKGECGRWEVGGVTK